MTDLLFSNQYFCVALTVIVFAFARAIQQKWNYAILNPIVISAGIIIFLLTQLNVPNSVYQEGCKFLNYLLTPATICLAISFYEQYRAMRGHMGALILELWPEPSPAWVRSIFCACSLVLTGSLPCRCCPRASPMPSAWH